MAAVDINAIQIVWQRLGEPQHQLIFVWRRGGTDVTRLDYLVVRTSQHDRLKGSSHQRHQVGVRVTRYDLGTNQRAGLRIDLEIIDRLNQVPRGGLVIGERIESDRNLLARDRDRRRSGHPLVALGQVDGDAVLILPQADGREADRDIVGAEGTRRLGRREGEVLAAARDLNAPRVQQVGRTEPLHLIELKHQFLRCHVSDIRAVEPQQFRFVRLDPDELWSDSHQFAALQRLEDHLALLTTLQQVATLR